jgi:hypothetical protein
MAEIESGVPGSVEKDYLLGGCRVLVHEDMENACYYVFGCNEDRILASFSFNNNQLNSHSRDTAWHMAEEYAHAYVHGYNDAMED